MVPYVIGTMVAYWRCASCSKRTLGWSPIPNTFPRTWPFFWKVGITRLFSWSPTPNIFPKMNYLQLEHLNGMRPTLIHQSNFFEVEKIAKIWLCPSWRTLVFSYFLPILNMHGGEINQTPLQLRNHKSSLPKDCIQGLNLHLTLPQPLHKAVPHQSWCMITLQTWCPTSQNHFVQTCTYPKISGRLLSSSIQTHAALFSLVEICHKNLIFL